MREGEGELAERDDGSALERLNDDEGEGSGHLGGGAIYIDGIVMFSRGDTEAERRIAAASTDSFFAHTWNAATRMRNTIE